ncbi:hypothetical protein DOS77_11810 [Staphylococcus felis]|uniref:Uncharacterized protein n=1 Tax=Staphylococcus felis TaxID=46127 RepID=A0ABS0QSH8_9STAP|nr:hypothetical protein [Staphylococcus felis]MBH9582137.1 hypothetical protein [Staphylococcus felis]REI19598.1 hypothetical protein DOS77_11810 [Staphylococcus felis]
MMFEEVFKIVREELENKLTVAKLEQIIREHLLKAYHQYGFNKYLSRDTDEIVIEINALEKLVDDICEAKGITREEFILQAEDE